MANNGELECLDRFITFRTPCGGSPYVRPTSGVHFEDLPGISATSLAALEPAKYVDIKTFATEKLRVAGQMIVDRMRNYIEPHVRERATREAGTIGTFSDATPLPGNVTPRGLRVKLDAGAMLVPLIPRVWIKSATSVTGLEIKLTDGEVEMTYTVDVVANVEKELWINYEGKRKSIDLVIENAAFEPWTGSTEGTTYFANCDTCGGHGRYYKIAGSALYGGDETEVLQGLRCEILALCSIEPVACILLNRFRHAVLYQWGVLIFEEGILGPRVNPWVTHTKEERAFFIEQWNTIEIPRYVKTGSTGLAAFIAKLDPDCLECGTGASIEQSL